jgi:hypothetical protein
VFSCGDSSAGSQLFSRSDGFKRVKLLVLSQILSSNNFIEIRGLLSFGYSIFILSKVFSKL